MQWPKYAKLIILLTLYVAIEVLTYFTGGRPYPDLISLMYETAFEIIVELHRLYSRVTGLEITLVVVVVRDISVV
ncbi:MAG: hypothetical protein F7C82_04185, partial [Desulfurococcales archaeon]|nr:hypothetical protein [Desulfurococcales archaeon]